MHVMQPPGVGRVTTHSCRPIERRSWLASIVRLPFEVCLFATELVAKRGGRRRPGSAGVFPLRLRGEPKFPILREIAGLAGKFSEFLTECLRLSRVDVAH